MLVVVDAIELAAEAPPTSLTTVFYLDDCGTIHSERIPWGILSTCSVDLLDEEQRVKCQEMDEEYSAREVLRTNSRLKAINSAVSDSSDPMSLFGVLRKAVLDLLHSGFEVDHRGSPEDIAVRDMLGGASELEQSDPTAHQRESLGTGDSYCGRGSNSKEPSEPFVPHTHF